MDIIEEYIAYKLFATSLVLSLKFRVSTSGLTVKIAVMGTVVFVSADLYQHLQRVLGYTPVA
jgi:hypothetical protein